MLPIVSIRRKVDIYLRPVGEDLGRMSASVNRILASTPASHGVQTTVRGSVEAMNASLRSFAVGLLLSVLLLYLIMVAQFRLFMDPFIILVALPPGIIGVMLTLSLTDTTLNIMSLMESSCWQASPCPTAS
jgi:multidrug efflux pump subunit AcrB